MTADEEKHYKKDKKPQFEVKNKLGLALRNRIKKAH